MRARGEQPNSIATTPTVPYYYYVLLLLVVALGVL